MFICIVSVSDGTKRVTMQFVTIVPGTCSRHWKRAVTERWTTRRGHDKRGPIVWQSLLYQHDLVQLEIVQRSSGVQVKLYVVCLNSKDLLTCYRDRATSGVDAGTSVWSPATARGVVSCLRSCRPSVCSRGSADGRLFHRRTSRDRSDHRAGSAQELCREDAIFDLRLHNVILQ